MTDARTYDAQDSLQELIETRDANVRIILSALERMIELDRLIELHITDQRRDG